MGTAGDRQIKDRLDKALALHRAGSLEQARSAYERLLEAAPEDANLLGLLGVLGLQQGRTGDAEALFRRALARNPAADPRVHLRDLNNYLVLLKNQQRTDDARKLVAGELPDWPQDTAAEASERATVLSLVEALLSLDQPEKARRLFDRAAWDRRDDAAAASLDGRLHLTEGNAEAAIEPLTRAAELMPEDSPTLIALGFAQNRLGRRDAAQRTMRRLTSAGALLVAPARPTQRATVLVLNPAPSQVASPGTSLRDLHYATNFPSQFSTRMQDDYRFISLFADLPSEKLPGDLPAADVVLNNIVNAEKLNVPGRLQTVCDTSDRLGLPMINHPRDVFKTTRQKNAELLHGVPNLRVPRIARYQLARAPVGMIADNIENSFRFPVILRHAGAHMSGMSEYTETGPTSLLVQDGGALRALLGQLAWAEFYAIEYIGLKKKSGLFRKIRAVITHDEVIVALPAFFNTWLVSGGRRVAADVEFYRSHPETAEEIHRIVRDPEGSLGAECLRTLEAIRERIPLDLFGVDFDVDDDGRLVLFEANAAMNFLRRGDEPDDIVLPAEPFERIEAAFHREVARRIGRSG
jgi:Flp pilus assembly protein TadD